MKIANSQDGSRRTRCSVNGTSTACAGRRSMTLLAIIVVLASGCAVYRIKTATNFPEARLATVEGSRKGFPFLLIAGAGYHLGILSIDGESVSVSGDWFRKFGMGPGQHVASYRLQYGPFLAYSILGPIYSWECRDDLRFEAQEGKQYIIEADWESEPVEVMLKDKQTDAIVTKSPCKGSDSSKP